MMGEAVRRYLVRVDKVYAVKNVRICDYWLSWLRDRGGDFAGLSLDELVVWQKANPLNYGLSDLVMEWVNELDLRATSKKRYLSAVQSIFMHNRAMLPKDPSFRVRSEVPKVVGDLSLEDFRMILASSNMVYRAMFLCMGMGIMGAAEMEYWNRTGWNNLKRDLDADIGPIRVDLPGRKYGRNVYPFYTFIGRDAVKAIRDYLPKRPKNSKYIFCNQFQLNVTGHAAYVYWHRHLKELGLIKPGEKKTWYGKNPHEIRDLFRTRWHKSAADPLVAEFMMGHVKQIDPNEYNRFWEDEDYVRSEYRKAEAWLNVLSGDPGKVSRDEVERVVGERESVLQDSITELSKLVEVLMKRVQELEKKP